MILLQKMGFKIPTFKILAHGQKFCYGVCVFEYPRFGYRSCALGSMRTERLMIHSTVWYLVYKIAKTRTKIKMSNLYLRFGYDHINLSNKPSVLMHLIYSYTKCGRWTIRIHVLYIYLLITIYFATTTTCCETLPQFRSFLALIQSKTEHSVL